MDQTSFEQVVWIWSAIGVLVLPLTLWITPPFGRHTHHRFGPAMSNRAGWILMESPAVWCFTIIFVLGVSRSQSTAWLFWSLWMIHYVYRCLVFPLRTRTAGKQIPLVTVFSGFTFQLINGSFNGLSLGTFGTDYTNSWLGEPVMWMGIAAFLSGWLINLWSDEILLGLRKPGETGYHIPRGGLFEWVSCPNFLGEMIQWLGWALMCWNIAALAFAIWTISNLLPRALAHHRWYQAHFPEYPKSRTALIPGLL